MEISRRHLPLELNDVMRAELEASPELNEAVEQEQRRLEAALAGSTRNQRRVAMKRAKKAARKAQK